MRPLLPSRRQAQRLVGQLAIVFVAACAFVAYLAAKLFALIAAQQAGVF